MEPVRSPRNQRVAAAVRLLRARNRRAAGMTLLEGPNLLAAAAERGVPVGPVFARPDDRTTARIADQSGYELVVVTQQVLDRLAPTQHPRGPVAVMAMPHAVPIRNQNVVVLWGVGDPGNAGTLIRSAHAFGFAVAIGPNTVDPWSPKVLRAAAGAHFSVPIERELDDLERLRARGIRTVAAVVSGGSSPAALEGLGPLALIVGEEAKGLPDEVAEACDLRVTIPMEPGVGSLNAAVAGSILMFAAAGGFGSDGSSHD